jgi:hypothetical protein
MEIGDFINCCTKYDKIEDIIMNLGNNAIVKIVIILYHYNRKNEKEFYLKENEYINKHGEKACKIIRNIESYLAIESKVSSSKQYVILGGQNIESFKINTLPSVEVCLRSLNVIYERIGDTNSFKQIHEVKRFKIDALNNQYIELEFGLKKYYSDDFVPCIIMYMNNESSYSIIPIQDFYNFLYLIKTIQLQTYTLGVLNGFIIPKK